MSKQTALRSFVAHVDGRTYRVQEGDEIEVPNGVDWEKAGFVEPAPKAKAKTAVKRKPAAKKAKKVSDDA